MQTQPDQAVDLAAMAAIDAAAIAGAKQTLRKAILFRRDARTIKRRLASITGLFEYLIIRGVVG